MPRIKTIFVLLLVAITTTYVTAAGKSVARVSISPADKLRFQEILNSIDTTALHNVFHEHVKDKYQHGIYQEDKSAFEVMHQENAEGAANLVELAKRQAANTTVTTIETSTAIVTTVPPTSTSESQSQSQTVNPTITPTSSTSQAPTKPPSTPTSTTSQAPSTTPPTTSSSQNTPTTSSNPTTQPSSSASTSGAPTTSSATQQTTNGQSSSTLSTKTSASDEVTTTHSVTQQTIFTTTLANGGVSTVTQVTVVAGQPDQTGGVGSSKTGTAKGSLQTNGANAAKNVGLGGLLGALSFVLVEAL